ncbi:uncharacterized protein LOC126561325 [Anopheles maculipalpis]|uniref:uncharacterized protein LOC126561325 n=1 Tax=Anopheles maculipalpis TaxID=1496333 RepID=UPI0021599C3A|nr:uncharacterized protein LOC126561325 [Anopheles maculipalpis]
MEDRDLAALEERLYSSIHHSYEDETPAKVADATPFPAPATRIVSRMAVVNNSQGMLSANTKRYWAGPAAPEDRAGERAPCAQNSLTNGVPKPSAPGVNVSETVRDGGGIDIRKMFLAPYQSLLGNNDGKVSENQSPSLPDDASLHQNVPERVSTTKQATKEPALQLKKKKQTKQAGQYVGKRLASLLKLVDKDRKENAMQVLESKKTKANRVRQRKRAPVVVAEICINSSDEESQPVKSKIELDAPLSLSDEETDEVIIIPTPPPPQICIDCSDEEEPSSTNSSSQFALPKTKKQKLTPATSSRCHSPSNSSIMSDDFIGQHDRSRLNDSFTESIPSDDELANTMEGNRRIGTSGKPAKETMEVRLERVPSISSIDTVCTNGDTTDQEKRPQETGKTGTAKSQPQANGIGAATNTKSKKDSTTTKKTPSKGKLSKPAPASSTVVEAANSPCTTTKGNANSKPSSGTISTDSSPKTPGKSKTKSISLVMELVRKQFESKKTRSDGSGKKAKSKKDASTTASPSDKPTNEYAEKDTVGKGGSAGAKSKSKKIRLFEENVSSESDYDILRKDAAASATTPQEPDKRSRRSALTFIEQAADVSSESDYDESFLQTKKNVAEKQTVEREPKKRIGRKRKQYNSETYSDEDFACLLTDIVRAVSDTEEDEDDEDDVTGIAENNAAVTKTVPAEMTETVTAATSIPNPVNNDTAGEEQPATSKLDRNPKKKRKVKDVPPVGTAEDGKVITTPPPDTTQMEEQPDPGSKKKKKAKEPKSTVKDIAADSSAPETQTTGTAEPVAPPSTVKRKKKQTTTAASVPTTSDDIQTIVDSDDEDIQLVVNTPRESARKTPTLGPDCAWNEEMKEFYNTSWAGENMDLEMVLRKMPYHTRQWHIVHRDRFPEPPRKEITCTNCGERGHVKIRCRNVPKLAICYMCGEKGHKEPRCPKTICLNCGAKTRSFVRGCKSCSREADVLCFLCGVRGHTQRSCPDLWRRYHSTTEDNVPLKEDFEKNPKARWCSICCRFGHQAHTCNDARRIFGHPIPNVNVSSYMPAYRGEYNRYSKHQNDEQERRLAENPTARYNLFSEDANVCEFNLPEMAQNEKGFYFNFLRSTGLLEKHEQFNREQEEAKMLEQRQQQELMQPPVPQTAMESTPPQNPPVVQIKEDPQPVMEQSATVAEPCQQEPTTSKIMPAGNNVPVVEENSNYSFSEFQTDTSTDMHNSFDNVHQHVEEEKSPPPADNLATIENNTDHWLSDYIPLTVADPVAATTSTPSPELPQMTAPAPNLPLARASEPDEIAPTAVAENAKVLLSKEHATLLLSEKGAEFLSSTGKQHCVQLSILFESVGNVLLITGTPDAQNAFHERLVQYLREMEEVTRNSKYFQNVVPRNFGKMSRYIAGYLRFLVREKDSMRHLLTQLNHSKNPETQEKCRRRLNTTLFGVYGLRDGRMHLNILRNQLALCKKAIPQKGELEEYQRVIISDAIRYIFSGYDHKNYDAVVEEFELLKRTNKLDILTFYDLGLSRIIKHPQTSEMPAEKPPSKGKKNKNAAKPNVEVVLSRKAKKQMKEMMAAAQRNESITEGNVHNSNTTVGGNDFIMNTTTTAPFPTIDPVRLQQLDNSTRYVHHSSQERENVAYAHYSKNWPNREWGRYGSPRDDRVRYHWYRQSDPENQRQQQSAADLSRLAVRANTLRDQELNQLQRLQDMLRR